MSIIYFLFHIKLQANTELKSPSKIGCGRASTPQLQDSSGSTIEVLLQLYQRSSVIFLLPLFPPVMHIKTSCIPCCGLVSNFKVLILASVLLLAVDCFDRKRVETLGCHFGDVFAAGVGSRGSVGYTKPKLIIWNS